MAYTINRSDNTAITVVEDGTVNQTLDVKLIGKNYAGYGEIQNENTVFMLENFAGVNAPPKAIRGQLWYDSVARRLYYYTGESQGSVKVWKHTGGADYSAAEPISPNSGDLWFDTNKDQLRVRTGNTWLSVGPQSAGAGVTQMVSREVLDVDGNTHSIIAATVNDKVVYIISEDEFEIDSDDTDSDITGFDVKSGSSQNNRIKKGLSLPYTNSVTGITADSPGHIYWGTTSNSLRLGGFPAADYVRSGSSTFTDIVRFVDAGYTMGTNDQTLAVYISRNTVEFPGQVPNAIFHNTKGPRLTFRVNQGNDVKTPLNITPTALEPGTTDLYNLGTSSKLWNNVYANSFIGQATKANTLLVGDPADEVNYRVASYSAGANTIAVRDGSGNLTANTFNGVATSATRLQTIRKINGVNFDGTTNIIIEDDTKVPLNGGTMTGLLTLSSEPILSFHAATKNYVDAKFGVGGVLPISSGGTSANTIENARQNLFVPSRLGDGASGTWSINISGSSEQLNGFTSATPATGNTIARRDAGGNLTANIFYGTATSANYADLAEKYLTDNEYEVGTVVMIGGEKEVTACKSGLRAIGVISGKPAYMMNAGLEGGQFVALKGRVPVKVVGSVKKGDRLVASDGGCATAVQIHADTFAIALETNENTDIKFVECLVL